MNCVKMTKYIFNCHMFTKSELVYFTNKTESCNIISNISYYRNIIEY